MRLMQGLTIDPKIKNTRARECIVKCPTIVRHRHLTIVGYFYDQIFI
ncbi:hypothetical protein ME806_18680 [Lactobacillus delbrueckii]|nr:hypothetical protein ME786_18910 [Lactobacillus delbrueckii]GHN27177.1 hypothetical protein ME787_18920 [Lactobacillus delbrueckii]GHN29004.1 hypothetical protein ME788_18160 [Lactobacillus delbrueckii]GHN61572.1 hypothetical protein ME806_18680 [Lactobacillus delbrueckii]